MMDTPEKLWAAELHRIHRAYMTANDNDLLLSLVREEPSKRPVAAVIKALGRHAREDGRPYEPPQWLADAYHEAWCNGWLEAAMTTLGTIFG